LVYDLVLALEVGLLGKDIAVLPGMIKIDQAYDDILKLTKPSRE